MKEALNLIWFKRDLRWQDHAPLKLAIADGLPLLGLFIFEDFYLKDPSWSLRHWQAQYHSLVDMQATNKEAFNGILVLEGDGHEIFSEIANHFSIKRVYSYQETGEGLSYQRDKKLAKLFTEKGILWKELEQNAVQRGRRNRVDWDENWRNFMSQDLDQPNLPAWQSCSPSLKSHLKSKFGISPLLQKRLKNWPTSFQKIGESAAQFRLEAYLTQKIYRNYGAHIGMPYESRWNCSRLSPFFAWGNLSIRQVYQRSMWALENSPFPRDLRAFISRLHWHSHFVQKFEMEESMEFKNLNPAFDSLKKESQPTLVEAWKSGQTGYPLVDACMRAVKETGYLNFRMRAVLVSFLCHQLWQNWQEGASFLAQQFLDYIPGIHYPQFQMQSGCTGINTIRIYNPVKQSLEKDPEAKFISEWLPELRELPLAFKHQPWMMTSMEQSFYNFELGTDYPQRIVDINESGAYARDILWAFRKSAWVRNENQKILIKHTTAIRDPQQRSKKIMQP